MFPKNKKKAIPKTILIKEFLEKNKQPISMAKVGKHFGWSQPIASVLLNEMAERGEIEFFILGNVKIPKLVLNKKQSLPAEEEKSSEVTPSSAGEKGVLK